MVPGSLEDGRTPTVRSEFALPTGATVLDAACAVQDELLAAGVASPDVDARWLLEAVTGLTRAEQTLERGRVLIPSEIERLVAWTRRRSAREPLQLVLGVAPFYGLDVQVRPGVLVPRPESERLVERVLDALRGVDAPRLLDIGTGSGAIALALAAARTDAVVTASDVEPTAVLVARANATALGLPVTVWRSDLLAHPAVRTAASEAHVVVANLPYLPEGDRHALPPELDFEPPAALFGGQDGLDVARALARQLVGRLRPGGAVWWELDPRNVDRFAAELEESGAWGTVEVFDDLTGRRRFLAARR
jgi:release factor glutamine methyltransferase